MAGNFKLVNGEGGEGKASERLEIKAEDMNALRDFLVSRFKGIFPACMFLSAYSGSTIATFAKQKGATRKDCEDLLAMLHNAITESFEQVFTRK